MLTAHTFLSFDVNEERDTDVCPACNCDGCSPDCVLAPLPDEVEDAIVMAMLASLPVDMTIERWLAEGHLTIGEPMTLTMNDDDEPVFDF